MNSVHETLLRELVEDLATLGRALVRGFLARRHTLVDKIYMETSY